MRMKIVQSWWSPALSSQRTVQCGQVRRSLRNFKVSRVSFRNPSGTPGSSKKPVKDVLNQIEL